MWYHRNLPSGPKDLQSIQRAKSLFCKPIYVISMKRLLKTPTSIRKQANNLVTNQTNAVSTTFPDTYFLILIQTSPSAVMSDKITDFRSQSKVSL